jgi:hypothetical protein
MATERLYAELLTNPQPLVAAHLEPLLEIDLVGFLEARGDSDDPLHAPEAYRARRRRAAAAMPSDRLL